MCSTRPRLLPILLLLLIAAGGCKSGLLQKRESELNCPTDIRQTVPWCAGEDAIFHCPCGPSRDYYGHRPTCWGSWPTPATVWRDSYCGGLRMLPQPEELDGLEVLPEQEPVPVPEPDPKPNEGPGVTATERPTRHSPAKAPARLAARPIDQPAAKLAARPPLKPAAPATRLGAKQASPPSGRPSPAPAQAALYAPDSHQPRAGSVSTVAFVEPPEEEPGPAALYPKAKISFVKPAEASAPAAPTFKSSFSRLAHRGAARDSDDPAR